MGKTIRRDKDYWDDDPYDSKWKKKKKKIIKKASPNKVDYDDRSREHGVHNR